jgi:hypothetical protein
LIVFPTFIQPLNFVTEARPFHREEATEFVNTYYTEKNLNFIAQIAAGP